MNFKQSKHYRGPLSPALHGSNFQTATRENDGFRPWRRKMSRGRERLYRGRQLGWNDARGLPPAQRRANHNSSAGSLTAAWRIQLWPDEESGCRDRRPSTIRRSPGTPFRLSPSRLRARSRVPGPGKTVNRTVPTRGGSM